MLASTQVNAGDRVGWGWRVDASASIDNLELLHSRWRYVSAWPAFKRDHIEIILVGA